MNIQRIAVVDDSNIFCFVFKKIIEKYANCNIEVLIFDNGKSALDFFEEFRGQKQMLPKLVFVDINMPILNGWQLLDSLVSINHPILELSPFFIVSSSDNDLDINKSKEYPFIKSYLNKPLDKNTLFAVLDQYLIT